MKSRIIFIFFVLLGFLSFSQQAFKGGEKFEFRMRYGFLNASYASLEINEVEYQGKSVFHAIGKGKTVGLAQMFFKIDDTYESKFDKETFRPFFFNRDIYEGGYTKKLHFFFNQQQKNVLIKNLENQSEKKISIDDQIKDVISAFYYFRNSPQMNHLKEGDSVSLDLIFDDDEIFNFKLKFLGREQTDTYFGRLPTLKFRPMVQDGRVFKEEESITLWVSDDANKIPLKMRASLRVGALTAELIDYHNIKNPSVIKK